ncbi:MAG: hypothetical protein E7290_12725 [Lachnospiraceae bacterium]|nr:hypothetical protein [Lachnospiraceae bacterium]
MAERPLKGRNEEGSFETGILNEIGISVRIHDLSPLQDKALMGAVRSRIVISWNKGGTAITRPLLCMQQRVFLYLKLRKDEPI